MKKIFLLIISCLYIVVVYAIPAVDNVLICDFSDGIPSNFALYDRDGNTLSVDMEMIGFKTGKAWIPYLIEEENNKVACSTSWYQNTGTSDDWMVTAPISVSGQESILKWRARAFDKRFRDGYAVYVSASGNKVEDFDVSKPIFSVFEETVEWSWHTVDLKEYSGQTIWIAFVNNSTDCSRLYLDDLFVGEPDIVDFTVDIPNVVNSPGEIVVKGTVFTELEEPVKGFSIGFSCGDKTYREDFPDVILQPGEQVSFQLKEGITIVDNETLDYIIWVEHDGWSKDLNKTVSAYTRTVVVEETTGTWCGWCIRGIVLFEQMKEKYPETFIGIAVHNKDVMTDEYYDENLLQYICNDGWPYCIMNRRMDCKGDPDIIPIKYESLVSLPSEVGMDVKAFLQSDESLRVSTNLFFAESRNNLNYRLAYVIVENNVHNPSDAGYNQNNYYAGSDKEMNGYEDKPAVIPASDMYYQDVARAIIGGFEGIKGSVPDSVTAHKPINYEYIFSMPDNIINLSETELVVLLLNNTSGSIVNARKISLKHLYEVNMPAIAEDKLEVRCIDNVLQVCHTDGNPFELAIYHVDGRLLYNKNSSVNHSVLMDGFSGVYILHVNVGGKTWCRKLVL